MEIKSKTEQLPGRTKGRSWTMFVQDLKEELKKVSWTTKEELLSCTKVVVLSTFIFGMGIYLVDLMIKGVLQSIKLITHLFS